MNSKFFGLLLSLVLGGAHAQSTPASVPYTPSWAVRHQLQLLADHAGLALTMSHWPLPLAAVEEAVSQLPQELPVAGVDLLRARAAVQRELQLRRDSARLTLQLRQRAEGVPGFDDNYTPGSSVQLTSEEKRLQMGGMSVAGRLGLRAEASSNGLDNAGEGWGTEGRYQARLEDTAAALGWNGWQVHAFSQRFWWGPGWQSSLVNGHNAPAWNGVGLQRSTVKESDSRWLRWMGPWTFELFMARAQDPIVNQPQPQGYMFGGMRLTLRPWSWIEISLSRGMQVGGEGRPQGMSTYVKALLGQEVNKWPWDTFEDSSGQIAGLDLRLRCPKEWGDCAVYTQGMGDDRRPNFPMPIKYFSLIGAEKSFDSGQQRVFVEWVNTNACSYPIGDRCDSYPGYINGVYPQGYTNGARWIASAFGSGAEVTTLGWMDVERRTQIRLHTGRTLSTIGSYNPRLAPTPTGPHGRMWGLSTSRSLTWSSKLTLMPELSYLDFEEGLDMGTLKRKTLRLGLSAQLTL